MKTFKEFKKTILEAEEELPEPTEKEPQEKPQYDKRYLTKSGKEVQEIDDRVTKAIIELKKQKSSSATKLIDQFSKSLQQKKMLDKEIEQLKEKSYLLFSELFEARDAVYTRVIETASLILTMSKETKMTTTKFNVDEFFTELEQTVAPNIYALLAEMRKKFTEVKTIDKKSTLTPDLKEGLVSDLVAKGKDFFKNVMNRLRKVDVVLDKWKEKLQVA